MCDIFCVISRHSYIVTVLYICSLVECIVYADITLHCCYMQSVHVIVFSLHVAYIKYV